MSYLWHMRTTVELPDELLMRIKVRAAQEGISIKTFLILAVQQKLEGGTAGGRVRRDPPVVHAGGPIVDLTPAQRDEALFV